MECVAPASTLGESDVRVSNNGVDYGESSFVFEYVDAVQLSSVEPAVSSRSGGTSLVLRGTGFRDTSELSCRFDESTSVSGTFVSDTEIHCVCPELESDVSIVDITLNGQDYSINTLRLETYDDSTRVLSIEPTVGSVAGGTKITVRGVHFVNAENLSCTARSLLR